MKVTVLEGDVLTRLAGLPDNSVHCVVTSPPYWQLRNYSVDGKIGLEPSLDDYISTMVCVFRDVRRVMRDDGVMFLNMGDSYARVSERVGKTKREIGNERGQCPKNHGGQGLNHAGHHGGNTTALKHHGWTAGCACGAAVVPCTVLDPFGGSGTTGQVALEEGRDAILIEINPEYVALCHKRLNATIPELPLC